jgi:uncharacterized protein
MLTQMGIGEAFITLLNEKGIPTPLAHVMLAPPKSRMDVLTDEELDAVISKSKLISKYNQPIDSESAYEILNKKLEVASSKAEDDNEEEATTTRKGKAKKEESFFDNPMVKQVGRTAAGIITRSLLGALGLGGRTSRSRTKSWF